MDLHVLEHALSEGCGELQTQNSICAAETRLRRSITDTLQFSELKLRESCATSDTIH